jgi:hypothetical protein
MPSEGRRTAIPVVALEDAGLLLGVMTNGAPSPEKRRSRAAQATSSRRVPADVRL